MAATLYAWATPAFVPGSPVDHTWVTTYDSRAQAYANLAADKAAQQDYWYCWGSFHAQGGAPGHPDGLIVSANGDLALARCLVQSNADCFAAYAARGTIFTYGVDGVCHQLANQVLYATAIGGATPLTAPGVNGYWASVAIYGVYGLQNAAWRSKIASCAQAAAAPPGRSRKTRVSASPKPAPPPLDEFEAHVLKTLGSGRAADAARLLAMRNQFHAQSAAAAHALTSPTADDLNARNQRFLDEAAKLLSAADFAAVFGFEPGAQINLVIDEPTKARN
jgi:hypothetical protein